MSKEGRQGASFFEKYLTGEALANDIDDYIDAWHEGSENQPLHEFLGMSEQEYALWLPDPDLLPYIALARRERKPLSAILETRCDELSMTARSSDATKIRRLRTWLEQHGKID
jgi:hypothetical protein